MRRPRKIVLMTAAFVFLVSFSAIALYGSGENSSKLSLSFRRNIGTSVGDNISGDFTLTGGGDGDIVSLELYFNGTMVSSSDSNELSFRFHTKDYPTGDTNITLVGYDGGGDTYQYTVIKNFLSPNTDIFIIIGVIVIVGTSVGLQLYRRYKKKGAEKEHPGGVDPKKIKIDIDKKMQ